MDTTKSDTTAPAGRTINDWAQQVGIARATFYLIEDECRPASVQIGRRQIIIESPKEWLARMAERGGAKLRRAGAKKA